MAVKDDLLGMPFGTAAGRLRKAIMFHLVCRLKENFCHRCGTEIVSVETFSIEHKDPWQSAADPIAAFFDLANISFSHHTCNVGEANKGRRKSLSREAWQKDYQPRRNAINKARYTPEARRDRYIRLGN